MSKRPEAIPKFSSEATERAFWEKNDSTEHLDWTKAQVAAALDKIGPCYPDPRSDVLMVQRLSHRSPSWGATEIG